MNYWLVKQEPEDYSWANLVKDGRTAWTGVRNYTARNNLRSMKKKDPVLFYHSVKEKQVVGICRVEREAYPDPTGKEEDWTAVDLVPAKPLTKSVTLEALKADKALSGLTLLRQTRLSVVPLTKAQFERILKLGGTAFS
jgi:predicted RNA-binding protein with PUA-like domain